MGEESKNPPKRTILFFQLFTWLGGGEYGVYDLARNLDRKRFHPVVMFNKRGPFVEKIEQSGIEIVIIPYDVAPKLQLLRPASMWRNIRASSKIREYIRGRGIDLIQCSDVLSLMLLIPTLLRLRKPVIFSLIFRYGRMRALLLNVLSMFGVKRFVSLSQWILDDVCRKTVGLRNKSSLVYWAVDTQKFHPRTAEDKKRLRLTFGLPDNKKIVGFVGRFDVWKGHITFLDAAKRVLGVRDNVLFIIVGDAITKEVAPPVLRYYDAVLERVERYHFGDSLLMWKHRNDIPDVMACLDVFVCPSEYEPFGLVVLEAMATGVPVVASDSGGPLEIIEEGKDGFLFPTGNAPALASAIINCIDAAEPIIELTRNARIKVEQRFTITNYVHAMEYHYMDILGSD